MLTTDPDRVSHSSEPVWLPGSDSPDDGRSLTRKVAGEVTGGVGMQGPLIFIATNRLKPERLDSERARVPGLVEFVEANETLR